MKTRRIIISILLLCAAVLSMAACGGAGDSPSAAIAAPVTASPAPMVEVTPAPQLIAATDRQSELAEAKKQNGDTVAWLVIPGADIDDPVVRGEDNAQYISLDAQGNYDAWGCYYADCRNAFDTRDNMSVNTVIYGHSESDCNPDGVRFSRLHRFMDADFTQDNPFIYLSVDGEDMVYLIAAVFITDVSFDYINPDPTALGGSTFFDTVNDANWLDIEGVTLAEGDELLTLSTCCRKYDATNSGNQRLVVMAKRVDVGTPLPQLTVTPAENHTMP